MEELLPNQYERVKPLFENIPHQRPVIFAALEGTQAGRVFADDARNPSAAVILSDWSYIGGSPEKPGVVADVADLLLREVFPKQQHVLLFTLNQPWQAALQEAYAAYNPRIYFRTRFDFDPRLYRELHSGWQQRIPAGFSLHRLDAATALEADGIAELWGLVKHFLECGFGFCLLDESQPDLHQAFAADAHAVFVGGGWAETGVGTKEAYRRRGLATAVSCAYIDHCLENGIYPEWTCMYNEASEKLAVHMGYVNKQDVPFILVSSPVYVRE